MLYIHLEYKILYDNINVPNYSPVILSLALYTWPYVPSPTWTNVSKAVTERSPHVLLLRLLLRSEQILQQKGERFFITNICIMDKINREWGAKMNLSIQQNLGTMAEYNCVREQFYLMWHSDIRLFIYWRFEDLLFINTFESDKMNNSLVGRYEYLPHERKRY